MDDTCDDVTGKCPCRPHVIGLKCDKCEIGYFGFPDCEPCNCDDNGSRDVACDDNTGKCFCKTNVIGDKCNFCPPGFFGFPACQSKTNSLNFKAYRVRYFASRL